MVELEEKWYVTAMEKLEIQSRSPVAMLHKGVRNTRPGGFVRTGEREREREKRGEPRHNN